MRRAVFVLTLFFFVTLSGCISTNKNIVTGSGIIIYLDFEGGFYGIVTDDGEHYDPINLPSEFEVDTLRVVFKGKIRDDLGSYHMWGILIELIYIEKL